jgi:hypothetical protein
LIPELLGDHFENCGFPRAAVSKRDDTFPIAKALIGRGRNEVFLETTVDIVLGGWRTERQTSWIKVHSIP